MQVKRPGLSGGSPEVKVFIAIPVYICHGQGRPFLGQFPVDQPFVVKIVIAVLLVLPCGFEGCFRQERLSGTSGRRILFMT